jgi:hypothetical protein
MDKRRMSHEPREHFPVLLIRKLPVGLSHCPKNPTVITMYGHFGDSGKNCDLLVESINIYACSSSELMSKSQRMGRT